MKIPTKILDRIIRNNAVGIIYNFNSEEQVEFLHRIQKENHIIIDGKGAFIPDMLKNRISYNLKIKNMSWNMLPTLIPGKMVVVTNADMIKNGFARVFEEFRKYKVPLLLLLNYDTNMVNIRNFHSYQTSMIIEYDYSKMKKV